MNTSMLIWIVVVVVVILVIIGIVVVLGRKRRQEAALIQANEDRERAGRLREEARDADLAAREQDVAATRAAADAEEAAVEAERLRIDAEQQRSRAQADAARSQERVTQAEALDPDVQTRDRRETFTEPQTSRDGTSYVGTAPDERKQHDTVHDSRYDQERLPNSQNDETTTETKRHGRRRDSL